MISKEFHASRRAKLAEYIKPDSLAFIFCGEKRSKKGDQFYPFTPYANFYYLTGFEHPKAVLMIRFFLPQVQFFSYYSFHC